MKDKKHFLEQVFAHQAIIHKICKIYRDNLEDREDLFQEIIYQLWKSFDQFKGKSKLTTWMYRVGLNTAMATFRNPKITQTGLEEYHHEYVTFQEEIEDENNEKLLHTIRQLKEADRALLSLYFEDLNYREIGEVLGISESNVGVRLTRIKEKLKKLLNT